MTVAVEALAVGFASGAYLQRSGEHPPARLAAGRAIWLASP
jgi:hypothetical protein